MTDFRALPHLYGWEFVLVNSQDKGRRTSRLGRSVRVESGHYGVKWVDMKQHTCAHSLLP